MEKETIYFKLDLPSRLLPYKDLGVTQVEIQPLKGKHEKYIVEFNIMNFERKFCDLLNQGIIKGINPEELTIGDRLYIMIWLSSNCFSEIYPVDTVCDECFKNITVQVKLNSLEKVLLEAQYKEPKVIKISNKDEISVRLLRVKDQINYLDRIQRTQQAEPLYQLALTIVDDKHLLDRIKYLEELSTKDTALIRAFQEDYFHGIKLEYNYTCEKCGGVGLVPVPFRLDLFFPTSESLRRSL